jgi:hypothetical protein
MMRESSYLNTPPSNINMQLQTTQSDALNDIAQLQQLEKEYYTKLSNGLMDQTLTQEDKDYYTNKITELSNMRINLYKNLDNAYQMYQGEVVSNTDTLIEETAALQIVENEITDAKRKLAIIEEDKKNKFRQVEISTYYAEKYEDQASIMKWIIVFCVPILFFLILGKRGVIPSNVVLGLIAILLFLAVIILGNKWLQTLKRNNMYYDEFDFKVPTDKQIPNAVTDTKNPWGFTPYSSNNCLVQSINNLGSDIQSAGDQMVQQAQVPR